MLEKKSDRHSSLPAQALIEEKSVYNGLIYCQQKDLFQNIKFKVLITVYKMRKRLLSY